MQVFIPGFNLPLTAASGQCFRFNHVNHHTFSLVAHGRHLHIQDLGGDCFEFFCDQIEFDTLWRSYFDLDRDYSQVKALPLQPGSYLHAAVQYAGGVRILRQEPFETIIAFILSQRKTIPAIKSCIEALSHQFGAELAPGVFAFPTPNALAQAEDGALKACGLGYRLPYVKQTAQMLAQGQVNLQSLYQMDDASLEQTLLRFPGVGKKVAACIMLFAYHRLDAFPVDVWIQRVLNEHYPEGFPFEQYAGFTGILQQYLFCYARHLSKPGAGVSALST